MSVLIVEDEVNRFLATNTPEVLCISGHWGVGKTFAWNHFLVQAKKAGIIAVKRYAYASLFGQNSLDDVKAEIFETTVTGDLIGKPATLASLDASLATLETGGRRIWQLARQIPIVGEHVGGAARMTLLAVRNQIVCLDDLERAGSDLELNDILGLASFLKEQRNCKVVLLLNQDALDGDDGASFALQLEKVADTFIKYNPTADESAAIAFPGTEETRGWLRDNAAKLGIVNIRVIKRAERVYDRAAEILGNRDKRLMQQIASSVVLFSYSKFQPSIAPTLAFIRSFTYMIETPEDGPEKEWAALVRSYGFAALDEVDVVLLDGVDQGAFDPIALVTVADRYEENLRVQDRDSSFSDAWRLFHDSFDVNDEELVSSLIESFKRCFDGISPMNADGTITLLRELGHDAEASELADFYLENRHDDQEFWDEDQIFGDLKDPEFISKIKGKFAAFPDHRTPLEVLVQIAKNRSWDNRDITKLAKVGEEEWVEIFKAAKGADRDRAVKSSLQFGRYADATPEMKSIAATSRAALVRIAKESKANELRVRRYGVTIPTTP